MTPDTLATLALFALAATWTPGPNNAMLAASGATFGWRRTLPHAIGVAAGVPVMVFLIAMGLGEVFQRSETLQRVLAWAGAAVMIWLGWRIATAGRATAGRGARPLTLWQAAAFQWVNPKAWVMAISAAATFVTGTSPVFEALLMSAVFLGAGITSSQAWSGFGAALSQWLGTGSRLAVFNGAMGAVVALSAVALVIGGG